MWGWDWGDMPLRKAKIKNKSPAREERLRTPFDIYPITIGKRIWRKVLKCEESLLFLISALFWNSSEGFEWQFSKIIFKNSLKIFYSLYKNIYIEIWELILKKNVHYWKPIIMSPYEELVIAIKINQGIVI